MDIGVVSMRYARALMSFAQDTKSEEALYPAMEMLELVSDYDYESHYHPGKANKVADVLSQKTMAFTISVEKMPRSLQVDMCN